MSEALFPPGTDGQDGTLAFVVVAFVVVDFFVFLSQLGTMKESRGAIRVELCLQVSPIYI